MFSARTIALSLCLASLAAANVALANPQVEQHRLAVTFVAMEQVCNNAVPGMNASVDNALANEPMDAALKAEIQAIHTEPRYKNEVDAMVRNLGSSPMGAMAVQQGLCTTYAAK